MKKILVVIIMLFVVMPVWAQRADTAAGKRYILNYKRYPGHQTLSYMSIGVGASFVALGGNIFYKSIFENYYMVYGGGAHASYMAHDKTANFPGVIAGGLILLIGAEFTYLGWHHLHRVHIANNGINIELKRKRKNIDLDDDN